MAQLWKGRFKKELAKETNDFNASIHFDSRMYKEDITGSMAHATMLGACGIIEKSESEKIVQGLSEILADIESGKLFGISSKFFKLKRRNNCKFFDLTE